jgi:hypothetical protein
VASRHPRIQVPRDPELNEAIARGRAIAAPGAPASQVIRALAILGAEAFDRKAFSTEAATQFLLDVADGRSGLDLESLKTVRDRAWR